MNHYIFLTTSIRNVGGAQLYIAKKQEWLESIGWKVSVFYYNKGRIVIDALKKHEGNFIDELSQNVYVLSSKQLDTVLTRILPIHYDKVIIESHLLSLCFWGEIIAYKANGMNLCYPLCEVFPKLKKYERDYFASRLDNNLLFGISEISVSMLLGESEQTKNRQLLAIGCCADNVADISYDLTSLTGNQTIISIGRQDKPYVPFVINEICDFISRHAKKSYNVILIGDSADKALLDTYIEKLSAYGNVSVICTGYIFPIPRCLFKKADVAIASSGSVVVANHEGVPTIVIDANDFQAIGVFKQTTCNTLYREFEPLQKVCNLLEDILDKNKFKKVTIADIPHNHLDYSDHLRIIDSYQNGKIYPKIMRRPITEYPMFFLTQLFGISGIKIIRRTISRVLLKLKIRQ